MNEEQAPSTSAQLIAARQKRDFQWFHERGLTPFVALIVVVGVVAIYDPGFLSPRALTSLLDQTAVLGLLALAQAVVVLTGRITLANAALASLGGVCLALLLPDYGWFGVIAVVLGAALLGLLLGTIHMIAQVPSFVVSLGGMGVFAGLSLWLSGADSLYVSSGYEVLEWMTWRYFGIPISFLLLVCIAGLMMLCFALFPIGRSIRAVGFNERASAFSGIRTTLVVVSVFALSGALSGLAATLQIAELRSAGATTADALLLPSIAAVLLGGNAISGGVGGIGRTLVGVLIITVLRVGLDIVGVPSSVQPIIYGVIVILTIAVTADRARGRAIA
ncbi:ABC transporter permease [Leucobacter tenebrionis]|uniref:ABC transporter permease n=1 Tax=Leucobacter tenebrionis TaxID=2873270 RepID=UPI001CA60990|nr:ABC transporter permease [Leucobacter tenebrionis]QZY50920.1 ABC transporter permease [Leucobacter tenebrionis]